MAIRMTLLGIFVACCTGWPAWAAEDFDLTEAASPWAGGKVLVLDGGTGAEEALADLAVNFEKLSGIAVKIDTVGAGDAWRKVRVDAMQRQSDYDMVVAPASWLGSFAANDLIEALDIFLTNPMVRDGSFKPQDVFFENAWKASCWHESMPYGLPLDMRAMLVWFRSDLAGDPGRLEAWADRHDEEMPTAEEISIEDVSRLAMTFHGEDMDGIAFPGGRNDELYHLWLAMTRALGGAGLEQTGGTVRVAVNDEAGMTALKMLRFLVQLAPDGVLAADGARAAEFVADGEAFCGLGWSDQMMLLEDPATSEATARLAYSPLRDDQGRAALVDGDFMAVLSNSMRQEPAYLFMQWLMLPENQIALHLAGLESARADTYEDVVIQIQPESIALVEAMSEAPGLPSIMEGEHIARIMAVTVNNALADRKGASEALDWAAAEIARLIGPRARLEDR